MKKAFLNIGSIFLAVLVLFSTFSFTVETHLCGGEVADYSFVGNLERCEMPQTNHTKSEETATNNSPCCLDIIETIEGSNDELSLDKELNEQEQFVAAFVASYLQLFGQSGHEVIPFQEYKPPLIDKDIRVLYETFLI